MLILEDLCRGLGIIEQLVDFFHLLPLHRLLPLDSAQHAGWGQQLDGVPAGSSMDNTQRHGSTVSSSNKYYNIAFVSMLERREIVLNQSLFRCFSMGLKPSRWTVNLPARYLSVVLVPISARCVSASSLMLMPSVWARIFMIWKKKNKYIINTTNTKVQYCWN